MNTECDDVLKTSDALEYLEELKAQKITHVHDCYRCSLKLDVGEFTHKDKVYSGKYRIKTDLSWRIETKNSILLGSDSPEYEIDEVDKILRNHEIENISFFGRLNNLEIKFKEGLWLTSFSTTHGDPQWVIDKKSSNLYSEYGELKIESYR